MHVSTEKQIKPWSHYGWLSRIGLHPHAGLAEGNPLPPHPEEDVNSDVDQQSDNKREVEGHHRGVNNKVWVGDGAHQRVICVKQNTRRTNSKSHVQEKVRWALFITEPHWLHSYSARTLNGTAVNTNTHRCRDDWSDNNRHRHSEGQILWHNSKSVWAKY